MAEERGTRALLAQIVEIVRHRHHRPSRQARRKVKGERPRVRGGGKRGNFQSQYEKNCCRAERADPTIAHDCERSRVITARAESVGRICQTVKMNCSSDD